MNLQLFVNFMTHGFTDDFIVDEKSSGQLTNGTTKDFSE